MESSLADCDNAHGKASADTRIKQTLVSYNLAVSVFRFVFQ